MTILEKIAFMRREINDSAFGRKINHSLLGLTFERSVFYILRFPIAVLETGLSIKKSEYDPFYHESLYPTKWNRLHTHTSPLYARNPEGEVEFKSLKEAINCAKAPKMYSTR